MSPAKRLALPQNLAEAADREGRRRWLVTVLPEVVARAQKRWSLTVGEPFQHMLNCEERLHANPRGLARRMAGLLDLDPDRVLSWLFTRCTRSRPNGPSWPKSRAPSRPPSVSRPSRRLLETGEGPERTGEDRRE